MNICVFVWSLHWPFAVKDSFVSDDIFCCWPLLPYFCSNFKDRFVVVAVIWCSQVVPHTLTNDKLNITIYVRSHSHVYTNIPVQCAHRIRSVFFYFQTKKISDGMH